MRQRPWLKRVLIVSICIGLATSGSRGLAAPPRHRQVDSVNETRLRDVALQEDGKLRGQTVNRDGVPTGEQIVQLVKDGNVAATTQTDAEGRFELPVFRGGVYQIVAGEHIFSYRVWQPHTAPPGATESVLLVTGARLVRGFRPLRALWFHPKIMAALIVAGYVSAHNLDNGGASD